MSFACHLHAICMSIVCTRMSHLCNLYVTRVYAHVIHTSLVCTHILSTCTHMPFVCQSYVLLRHLYVTRMYLYVLVCHSYVLVCHPYVTRMWFYHEPLKTKFDETRVLKKHKRFYVEKILIH